MLPAARLAHQLGSCYSNHLHLQAGAPARISKSLERNHAALQLALGEFEKVADVKRASSLWLL